MTQSRNGALNAVSRAARAVIHSRLALGALSAVIAGGIAAVVVIPGAAPAPKPAPHHNAPAGTSSTARHTRTAQVVRRDAIPTRAGWTTVAALTAAVPRYASPGGRPDGIVAPNWYGWPSALPVIGQQPGWVRVRLATRPNGSTAWLRTAHLTFSQTPFRIVINLRTRHLQMASAGHIVLTAPAGIGIGGDPTPVGQFFVAFYERPPGPGYGPFILVTSAHSEAIRDWEGSGDAVVGIHGPLGAAIGATGAAVSHGCIRLPVTDLVKLAGLPAGTPITITA